MNRHSLIGIFFAALVFASCSDDEKQPLSWDIGEPTATEYPEDYYAGGLLGTTAENSSTAFKQPTKAVVNEGMMTAFNEGEYLFEKDYNTNTEGAFHGLGPVYVRRGCLYCHPGYGHGARQTEYKADNHRNGYLLVIYDKTTNAYIRSVAGMPQTGAVKPFKAPVDEEQIKIAWNNYTDEWGNRFPDGETYELIYPEVTIPYSAYYAPVVVARGGSDVTLDEAQYNAEIGVLLDEHVEQLLLEYAAGRRHQVCTPLYLRPLAWSHPRCRRCQCHLEHHQRDTSRPPLPLPRPRRHLLCHEVVEGPGGAGGF